VDEVRKEKGTLRPQLEGMIEGPCTHSAQQCRQEVDEVRGGCAVQRRQCSTVQCSARAGSAGKRWMR
jgi:hypothetical protein